MKYDQNNFFEDTVAYFKGCKRPRRQPDYVSYNRRGQISSCYWYTPRGVIRASNHWSTLFIKELTEEKEIFVKSEKPARRWQVNGHYEKVTIQKQYYRNCQDDSSKIIQCGKVASCIWSIRSTKDEKILCGFCKWENFKPTY